jgi:hypothetical protein
MTLSLEDVCCTVFPAFLGCAFHAVDSAGTRAFLADVRRVLAQQGGCPPVFSQSPAMPAMRCVLPRAGGAARAVLCTAWHSTALLLTGGAPPVSGLSVSLKGVVYLLAPEPSAFPVRHLHCWRVRTPCVPARPPLPCADLIPFLASCLPRDERQRERERERERRCRAIYNENHRGSILASHIWCGRFGFSHHALEAPPWCGTPLCGAPCLPTPY